MVLAFNFTFKNKNRSIFCKAQLLLSFTKMRVSEQDVVLSDCVREFPCLYDKRTPEFHLKTGPLHIAAASRKAMKKLPKVFFFLWRRKKLLTKKYFLTIPGKKLLTVRGCRSLTL